ncbi:Epidermal retinol dehydrogenase 2-like 5 [Homarus americanus]|uniref:Epidermal retinol dehydrogenase 2-like 5 n=1 Tax=Homarus americanus TaxID=6706 RepID=A0A8J5JCD8_HOMAM|nr:Epidermal retinol dehydrogenase 2-like 5 [Homarus americanus]
MLCQDFYSQVSYVGQYKVTVVMCAGNEETAKLVVAAGGEGHAYSVDLCDRHAIYATATKVKQEVGKVDILVNNAGIVTGRNFIDAPDHLIQKTFDVNIMSHFWTTKAFLGDMLASNRGHVVEGYTGVKTTAVCPYYISTGMFDGVKSKVIPILKPEYVASEIVDGILLNTPIVVLPPFCKYLVLLKYLLPAKGSYQLYKACGGHLTMDDFRGRTVEDGPCKMNGAQEKRYHMQIEYKQANRNKHTEKAVTEFSREVVQWNNEFTGNGKFMESE